MFSGFQNYQEMCLRRPAPCFLVAQVFEAHYEKLFCVVSALKGFIFVCLCWWEVLFLVVMSFLSIRFNTRAFLATSRLVMESDSPRCWACKTYQLHPVLLPDRCGIWGHLRLPGAPLTQFRSYTVPYPVIQHIHSMLCCYGEDVGECRRFCRWEDNIKIWYVDEANFRLHKP